MTSKHIRFTETLMWLESQLPNMLNRKADVALSYQFPDQVVARFAATYAAQECIDLNYSRFLLRKACQRWIDRPSYLRALRNAYETRARALDLDGALAETVDLDMVQHTAHRVGIGQSRIVKDRANAI